MVPPPVLAHEILLRRHILRQTARDPFDDCGLKSALMETAVTGGTAQRGDSFDC
jgi:hypothetical protein